ncbi:MAG: rRNA maturation RNase YbeY [Desulfobaccales bacterium]
MGWSEAELSLTILGDRAMARLNRETFGRRGPTNVISFPLDAPDLALAGDGLARESRGAPFPGPRSASRSSPPMVLGEVVISLGTTINQARELGWPWQGLFDFYMIHGILHLLGYDHGTPAEEAAMTGKTWELMGLLQRKLK